MWWAEDPKKPWSERFWRDWSRAPFVAVWAGFEGTLDQLMSSFQTFVEGIALSIVRVDLQLAADSWLIFINDVEQSLFNYQSAGLRRILLEAYLPNFRGRAISAEQMVISICDALDTPLERHLNFYLPVNWETELLKRFGAWLYKTSKAIGFALSLIGLSSPEAIEAFIIRLASTPIRRVAFALRVFRIMGGYIFLGFVLLGVRHFGYVALMSKGWVFYRRLMPQNSRRGVRKDRHRERFRGTATGYDPVYVPTV